MLFYRKFIVRKHERGLLFRDGDFQSFLAPGEYRYLDFRQAIAVETFDTSKPAFDHRLVDYLLDAEPAAVGELLETVETSAGEIALVFFNEQLAAVAGPASKGLYWKGPVAIRIQRITLENELALDKALARRLLSVKDSAVLAQVNRAVYAIAVPAGHVGLLYVDGKFSEALDPGSHAFWKVDRDIAVDLVDLRVRTLEVQGQEILTRDKVALRINVTATYQFTDAAKAAQLVKDPLDHLYKEIQFGLRAAVGTRTLDNLLEDKSNIDRDVADYLGKPFAALGIDVKSVGVKDIILPGDMKELLAQVVEAEKAAQANVIRRREETNATRSLLNTAKVMESNSVALRLKELETLERVTGNVGSLSVYGGLDAVMNGLVQLGPQKEG
ncbi:hypothetical protein AB833_12100 [Chromatiales bacterium (ex Bugula neritina AB1)]|nr:hypothetical protein AB833_12100 [Chromatiales bacterium (ex Bugula neritina AB1)]